jgi:Protein of unknown function (DUF2877)
MTRRLVVAGVASALIRDLITGPVRPASVLADGEVATYLDVDGRLVAVVAPGGVRLPCAVVLTADGQPLGGCADRRSRGPSGPAPKAPRAGSNLVCLSAAQPPRTNERDLSAQPRRGSGPTNAVGWAIGGGAVHQRGRPALAVGRWFEPRVRVPRADPRACARLATLVRSRGEVDPLLPPGAIEHLADDLAAGDPGRAVAVLLGRGTGLTPAGDDLMAGALAALRALGSPAADDLGRAVREMAPVATTRLSAALLDAADLGAVVPEAAAVLRSLAGAGGLDAATDRLLAVGHTSGWHLAAGLVVGVAHHLRSAEVPAFGCDGLRRPRTPVGGVRAGARRES